jgi:hypothetical protein
MITKESGYVLPRRILDEATEETLRERLQEWVGDRLKRRTSRGRT